MKIIHDHPCAPIIVEGRGPLAGSFTYDCNCGKLMIARNCSAGDELVFGVQYFMTLPGGRKVIPRSIAL